MADFPYQALLLVSFGGPEAPGDVIPFLERVTADRNIPRERLLEVAEHYQHFGGKSPINNQNRALIDALRAEFDRHGIALPIYWGNRNWHPFVTEALEQMRADGVRRALAFVTSAYSSYSGCRQYRENIAEAQRQVGPDAPAVDKLRVFYNHPHFVDACADRLREGLERHAAEAKKQFGATRGPNVLFTAHSIPCAMADTSDYVLQLTETCRLVAERAAQTEWELVYQSRSGPPQQPWLEPDVLDRMRALSEAGVRDVVLMPIGFISDHMEVLYDLDTEAATLAKELEMQMTRAETAGIHPVFIRMIRELVEERLFPSETRLAIGDYGPNHDVCPAGCCPAPRRPQPAEATHA